MTQIREDGKVNLTMKEVDQETGVDLNPEHTDKLADGDKRGDRKNDKMTRLAGGIKVDFEEAERRGVGAITGILLDSNESKFGVDKKTIDPMLLWEKSRFQGGGIMGMVDDPNFNNMQDMDELELEEE